MNTGRDSLYLSVCVLVCLEPAWKWAYTESGNYPKTNTATSELNSPFPPPHGSSFFWGRMTGYLHFFILWLHSAISFPFLLQLEQIGHGMKRYFLSGVLVFLDLLLNVSITKRSEKSQGTLAEALSTIWFGKHLAIRKANLGVPGMTQMLNNEGVVTQRKVYLSAHPALAG